MAPEQLQGQGASLRSDVYALGLVLHEILTGKRVFDAKSVNELRALHAESKPLSPSTGATDIDPALDRLVVKCLARDPAERPASARVALALLPGRVPLQAAILAGETPSPEMVAAASKAGDISSAAAWSGLIAGLGLLAGITTFEGRHSLLRNLPAFKSPAVLEERARAVLGRAGFAEPAVDSAYGFSLDSDQVDYFEEHDFSLQRRANLQAARPGAVRYFNRQSPRPLVARGWVAVVPWGGPPELGRITPETPPLTVPGMANVTLDAAGTLVSLTVVPPRFEAEIREVAEPDWSGPMIEAGLDPRALTKATPRWASPVDSDRKSAWDGSFKDHPQSVVHVEAASYHGRPVYFDVQGPWVTPPSSGAPGPGLVGAASRLVYLVSIPVIVALLVLVRRNLRLGRGDRKGAFRLAVATFAALAGTQALRADHTILATEEYALLIHILGQAFYAAIAPWAFYMALEPVARRLWPQTLISWARVLTGRFADPLVGRDVMIGIIGGLIAGGRSHPLE